jgi:hypothetical protein
MGDPAMVFQFILENGFPISKLTFIIVKNKRFPLGKIMAFYLINDILHLAAVGTNVLHGAAAYQARDANEILSTVKFVLDGEAYKIGPVLAPRRPDIHRLIVFIDNLYTLCGQSNDGSLEIFGEKDVAPFANHQIGLVKNLALEHFVNILVIFHNQQFLTPAVDVEGVVRFEGGGIYIFHNLLVFLGEFRTSCSRGVMLRIKGESRYVRGEFKCPFF